MTKKKHTLLGTVVWQYCCRLPQSLQTSLSCCRGSSENRHLHSWNRLPQQLDWVLRSTRYTVCLFLLLSWDTYSPTYIIPHNWWKWFVCIFRPSWCMQLVFMPTWEITSPLETPSSSQICLRLEVLSHGTINASRYNTIKYYLKFSHHVLQCQFRQIYYVTFFRLSTQDKLEALVKASQAFQEQPTDMEALWNSCSCSVYALGDREKQLGLGDKVGTDFRPEFRPSLNSFSGMDLINVKASDDIVAS